jgi:hypothetical protein
MTAPLPPADDPLAAECLLPVTRIVVIGGDTIYRQDIEAGRILFPHATMVTGLASTEAGRVTYLLMDHATPPPDAVVPLGYAVRGKRVGILREGAKATLAPSPPLGPVTVT